MIDVIKINITIRFAWETNKMESRVCVVTEREFVSSGSLHQTVSVVWNTRTSCADYIPHIYSLECMAAWNPSKPQRHSSLVERFPWHIF